MDLNSYASAAAVSPVNNTTGAGEVAFDNTGNAVGAPDGLFSRSQAWMADTTAALDLTSFATIESIPADATIDSFTVTVAGYVSSATRWASITVDVVTAGGVSKGPQSVPLELSTTNVWAPLSFTVTSAEARAGLTVRVRGLKGTTVNAAYLYVDSARIDVTYTPGAGGGAPAKRRRVGALPIAA